MHPLDLQSVLAGILLLAIVMLLAALLVLYTGQPLLRRLAERLLTRRGFEKLGRPVRMRPLNSPYETWLAAAKSDMPVHECLYIDDVRSISLQPWEQLGAGVRGLYLRLADYQVTDGRLVEIPPMGTTLPARHLYEMTVYFLGGPGHTVIYPEGGPARRIEWTRRSIYSIPMNTRYQHFSDSAEPLRLLAITSFPFMLNASNNEAFVLTNPFTFNDRIGTHSGPAIQGSQAPANFEPVDIVPDALEARLFERNTRGQGAKHRYWTMSNNSMIDVSVSEMAGRSRKHAHRSTSDATVLMLSGQGYALTWPEGAWHRKIRVNWRAGTLIAQPIFWYRQFMNLDAASARNLTVSAGTLTRNLGLRFFDQLENDLPEIKKGWVKELRLHTRATSRSLPPSSQEPAQPRDSASDDSGRWSR